MLCSSTLGWSQLLHVNRYLFCSTRKHLNTSPSLLYLTVLALSSMREALLSCWPCYRKPWPSHCPLLPVTTCGSVVLSTPYPYLVVVSFSLVTWPKSIKIMLVWIFCKQKVGFCVVFHQFRYCCFDCFGWVCCTMRFMVSCIHWVW